MINQLNISPALNRKVRSDVGSGEGFIFSCHDKAQHRQGITENCGIYVSKNKCIVIADIYDMFIFFERALKGKVS